MDLNKVMLIGRLTRDPELRAIPSGVNVCQIGLATNFVYTNQQTGQKVENVEYHNVALWRKLGEIAHQYLKKGSRVYIEGRLQTRSWDGQDGQKRYKTEIVADNMIMLDSRSSGGANSAPYPAQTATNSYKSAAASGPLETSQPAAADSPGTSQPASEELPTIQQGEEINVEDIPF